MANLATSEASALTQFVGAAITGTWVRVTSSGRVGIELAPVSTGTLGLGKDTISVETNSSTGYRLYISGINAESNGYTALYKDGDISNSKLVSTPNTMLTPTSLTAGQWGYAVPSDATPYNDVLRLGSTMDQSVINSLKFYGVKQEYAQIKSTSSANVGNPDQTNVYYGVMADTSTPFGSYYNAVVYTAFIEASNSITISPTEVEDGQEVVITSTIQDLVFPLTADRVTITLTNPNDRTQDIGTCDNITITSDGTVGHPLALKCTYHKGANTSLGTTYELRLEILPEDNNGIAMAYSSGWKYIHIPTTLEDEMYMQDVTSTLCTNNQPYSTTNKTYTLIDKRDNKQYLVRKLADNKCWMVQNLALEGGKTLTSADTNLPDGVSYPLPDGTAYTGKFSSDTAEDMYNGSHKDATVNNTSDNTGAYYNWNVATAGYDTAGSLASGNSDRSICPKGWKLPTSTNSGEFKALYTAYSSNKTNLDTAFNTVYVGYYYNGSLSSSGSYADWWSSTINSATRAYHLYENSSRDINPSDNSRRRYGWSVRCVVE